MKNKLTSKLEKLKSIMKNPQAFLIQYFTGFKYEIDDLFDQKYELEEDGGDRKDEIRFAWTNVNKKIEAFRIECIKFAEQSLNENNLKEINDSIKFIENKLAVTSSHTTSLDYDDLEELLEKNEFQLEKILFSNKTPIFLDTLNLCGENLEMLAGMDTKLVFLTNDYISKSGIDDLKKDQIEMFKDKTLTNEKIKIKLLNEKIGQSSQYEKENLYQIMFQMIELDLNDSKNLFLAWTSLNGVHPCAFTDMICLEKLYLYHNQIESISPATFNCLVNLDELDLSFNKLHTLSVATFNGLLKLRVLRLDSNQIKTIDVNLFRDLPSLESLDLSGNLIESVELKLFDNTAKLKYLHLDNNRIKVLEKATFHKLNNLEKLELSYNQLTSLDSFTFIGLNRIEELCLDHNLICSIEPTTFNSLITLKELRLDNNRLETIDSSMFRLLINLKELYLWNNSFIYREPFAASFLHKSVHVRF